MLVYVSLYMHTYTHIWKYSIYHIFMSSFYQVTWLWTPMWLREQNEKMVYCARDLHCLPHVMHHSCSLPLGFL